jgi:glucokinase
MLAAWLGSVVSLLDPDIVVIGGGMSQIGEPLFERIRREVPRRTINKFAAETPIVPAKLRENCGIIGAATVALDLQSTDSATS